ncbi:MAG: MarC family protein [Phycisphaeraceae bacterium]|nr:MAG: MarC family protein [Phycisphaeraceae bacterium]
MPPSVLSNAVVLFFIIDPFGLIPVFVGILKGVAPERRTRILVRELLIALAILLLFFFAGRHILGTLHISEPALTLAGAIILFLIALPMIFPSIKLSFETEGSGEPLIVPLATPMLAGPSAIAMVILLGTGGTGSTAERLGSVGIAWLAAALTLVIGMRIAARIGKRTLIAIERLMGMLLVAISVEMFLGGLRAALATIP